MMAPPTKKQHHQPSKGWGLFRYEWYSICSGHGYNHDGNYYEYDTDCSCCLAGRWVNCWLQVVESYFYNHHYPLWFWWANHHQYSFWQGVQEGRKAKTRGN